MRQKIVQVESFVLYFKFAHRYSPLDSEDDPVAFVTDPESESESDLEGFIDDGPLENTTADLATPDLEFQNWYCQWIVTGVVIALFFLFIFKF